MAHILLGWELGGGRGHAVSLLHIAEELRSRGHKVSFALQRIDAISPEQAEGSAIWPVPLTPRLLQNSAQRGFGLAASMGDILARLGFNDSNIVAGVVGAWHRLLDAIEPDAIVSNFGPFLLLAARGRCPTISSDTGFSTPPSVMAEFPMLREDPPSTDQRQTLEAVNSGLGRVGCAPLERLPQLFEASREIAATMAELDPYAEWRKEPYAMPSLGTAAPPATGGGGDEVFVYAHHHVLKTDSPFWTGIASAGLPVRVYVGGATAAYRSELVRLGLKVEEAPVPFERIAERSRLLISHGGHGTVCSALMAGLPHIVCHYDLEKRMNGHAVARAGFGTVTPLVRVQRETLSAGLLEMYRSEPIAARARAAAPGFHARYPKTMGESLADGVEAVLKS